METFNSITNVIQEPSKEGFYLGNSPNMKGPYDAPPPDENMIGNYSPSISYTEKSPVNSNGSWSQIKKSGAIVMSPYFHRKNVITNSIAGTQEKRWFAKKDIVYDSTNDICYTEDTKIRTSWTEQGDLLYWSKTKGLPIIQLGDTPDADGLVSEAQSSAVADFKGGYDVLTELAESREAMRFFSQTSGEVYRTLSDFVRGQEGPVRDATRRGQTARELLRSSDKAARNVGRRWLAFRYAIMPLIYSYRDISKLIQENGTLYKTYRSRRLQEITAAPIPVDPVYGGRYLFERYSGSITATTTVKAGYSATGLSSFVSNQLQANVFSTAWELIPFSFVFDWFVNVGDFIVSQTSADFSSQSKMCTAVRKRLLREVFLVDTREIVLSYDLETTHQCAPDGVHWTEKFQNSSVTPLVVESIDHYDRHLFSSSDVSLAIINSPFGDWRRLVDSAALSYRPLKDLLRRVK